MPSKKSKNVKQAHEASVKKIPKNAEDPNGYLSERPVWVFQRCDRDCNNWNLCNCIDFYNIILDKLISFEGMTWNEIQSASGGRHVGTNNHFVKINEMVKEARDRAKEIKLDVDEMFSLRLDGTKRLYGILQNGIYSIVWYTDNHEIYPSHKRNT